MKDYLRESIMQHKDKELFYVFGLKYDLNRKTSIQFCENTPRTHSEAERRVDELKKDHNYSGLGITIGTELKL